MFGLDFTFLLENTIISVFAGLKSMFHVYAHSFNFSKSAFIFKFKTVLVFKFVHEGDVVCEHEHVGFLCPLQCRSNILKIKVMKVSIPVVLNQKYL